VAGCVLDRQPSLHLRLRGDQICEALDLDKIELAVFKSASGKLAFLRETKTWKRSKRSKERVDDGLSAMHLELGAILTCERCGRGEKK
jgi:hypothetical protein